jgi:hypothetical protein
LDRPDAGVGQVVLAVTKPVQLGDDLDRWSGKGTRPDNHDLVAVGYSAQRPWRLRVEQVGVPSGMSPV